MKRDTDLDKLLQLFSDLLHQLRTGDAFSFFLVVHGSDLRSSSVDPFA